MTPTSQHGSQQQPPATASPVEKSPAVSITLNRAEGPAGCLGKVTLTAPGVWAQARRQLSNWGLLAPTDGSYDKVDVLVEFANGRVHRGRFDLYGHGPRDLSEGLRSAAHAHLSLADRLPRLDPAPWRALLDEVSLVD